MRIRSTVFVFLLGVTLWYSCVSHDLFVPTTDLQIHLRWIKSYPSESQTDVNSGMQWALSYLGAQTQPKNINQAVAWTGANSFTLDVDLLGYSAEAKKAWRDILRTLKTTDEYRIHGSFDVGRFTMLTLNSVNHYYAITGAPKTLDGFRAKYSFHEKKAGVINSSIALGHRVIEISDAIDFDQIAFLAREGEGSIEDETFAAVEFEAMDFMANGQLRFALYDNEGKLKTAADPSLTRAGKPTKCLWCHEGSLLPPFDDDHQLLGYWSSDEFRSILSDRMEIIESYRSTLGTTIDFVNPKDHTKAELLYLSFMEPSAERLASEWGISVDEVKSRLTGLPTHPHPEFSFLGDVLYYRSAVDELGPYTNIRVPDEPRNASVYEPDFIKP